MNNLLRKQLSTLDGPRRRLVALLALERHRPLLELARGAARHETAFGAPGFTAASIALDAWWSELLDGVAIPPEQAHHHERAIEFLARTDKVEGPRAMAVTLLLMAFHQIARSRDTSALDLENVLDLFLSEMEAELDPDSSAEPTWPATVLDEVRDFDPTRPSSLEAARAARTRVQHASWGDR